MLRGSDLGSAEHAFQISVWKKATLHRWRSFLLIFPWTYSITEDGMVSVTVLVAVTTMPRHFRFCFLVTVVLCALGLLNDIRGGCTWRRGYMRLQHFLSEIVLWRK